jgi:cytochrome c oxidase subunit 2
VGLPAAVVALALSGCDLPRFGAPDPASDQGRRIGTLWSGFFLAAVAVALLVWVLLAVVLIRSRRRPGDDDHIPSQRAYNIPVEVAYTALPVIVVAVLFFFSIHTERQVTRVSKDPAVRVRVVGFQWGWRFEYPGFTVDAEAGKPPELVLPLGKPSNLRLVSTDVNHSFWVPRFLSKRDLIPNVRNEITVTPTRTGTYIGRCAEFCGLDHWQMYFTVRVVPDAEYATWAHARRSGS